MNPFLDQVARRVVVFDGSMGATIQNMTLDIERDYLGRENCVDVLVRSRPDLVQSIHESFLTVGADAVETDTFGASEHVLGEFDEELRSWTYDLNKVAAEIARAACDKHSTPDKPRFVIGSMGPGTKLITLGQIDWDRMVASYSQQIRGLVDGGVDALLIETCQDLLQVKAAINAALNVLDEKGKAPDDVPIMVSVTIETMGTMLLGTEFAGAVAALRSYPIASLGLNCATGPKEMGEHVAYLSRHWDRAISVIPNAGLPELVDGKLTFPLTPVAMRDTLIDYIEKYGVNIVGGCCGTSPEHIELLAGAVGDRASGRREFAAPAPSCASLYGPVEYRQELSFLNIGERMNASGSRKFKRLLEEENWDEIMSLAREQVREGANVLDINVDYAGRDNADDMAQIVRRVVQQAKAALMIDSTQIATIEAGLKHAGGRCIINSANFEDGEEKFDAMCALAKRFGAGLVLGTIDEDPEAAMARTADRKHAIAQRSYGRAVNHHGLDPVDLFFDPLVLPITTGMDHDRRSALELIEGTRRISKSFPQCQITCGLSNASFGLVPPARMVLNSVLLHELLEAGLTSAIVHSSKILPLNRISQEQQQAALDLIYDRRAESKGGTGLPEGISDESFDPLSRYIELFADAQSIQAAGKHEYASVEEALRGHIVDGEKQGLHERLDEALGKYSALEIINDHLLDGMKTVGELFGSGKMQLPFVLQSAEVMKMAVAHLEPHMDKADGGGRGSIVLATVKGDVHDIGKNLVDIILSNNGYTVYNLGIKQPIANIIEAHKKHKTHAIGLSGLLVKSVNVMSDNLEELNALGMDVPVLLGGAALSRQYAEGQLRPKYRGPLFYGQDAFAGLHLMDAIVTNRIDAVNAEIDERVTKRGWAAASGAKQESAASPVSVAEEPASSRARLVGAAAGGCGHEALQQPRSGRPTGLAQVREDDGAVHSSTVDRDAPIPSVPFWGSRVADSLDLNDVYPYINKRALFRGQWGFKRGALSKEGFERNQRDVVEPVFERLCEQLRDEKILQPRVVYGYFPCTAHGNDIVIYDPDDHEHEIERFTFPRQSKRKRLCLADYFRPIESLTGGERDVIGLFVCTVGDRITPHAHGLFERNEYSEYLYVHGLGVECAEGLAEYWHKVMRDQMGIGSADAETIEQLFTQGYQGRRYSFGYPACPEMDDQATLFRLLDPERIGCQLTESMEIDPEQSVSALVVHHPQATYFQV